MTKQQKRLHRQITTFAESFPVLRRPIAMILHHRWRLVRIPVALLMIFGSFLAILPVFGLWMLPLGLLLLAVDIPVLQPWVSATIIRTRRRWRQWWTRGRGN